MSLQLAESKQVIEAIPTSGDIETGRQLDSTELIGHDSTEAHVSVGEFIKSAVYGGVDGIITVFNIAISAIGGNAGVNTIVSLGVSSLIADGLAMGIADFLSSQSEEDYMQMEKVREQEEIENDFAAEKVEMSKLYADMGMNEVDSKQIVEVLSTQKQGFLDIMMVEELGLIAQSQSPLVNSMVTFFSFAIFGLLPLLPFIVAKGQNLNSSNNYVIVSGCLTAFFLFVLGFSKSIIVLSKWYVSGVEAVFIGALAAGAAYGMGKAFGAE